MKCNCGGTLDAVNRSATPGLGLDHLTLICEKCKKQTELFGKEAADADAKLREKSETKTQ